MRLALVLLLSAALAAPASAQEYDEADEGTFSTYSAEEARVALEFEAGVDEELEPTVDEQEGLLATFFRELAPHGRWEQDYTYGWVWYPNEPSFRPYANGGWSYTTEGWTFVSDAPYAWAVYHYGRWAYLNGGWAWIPGYEWSPAWVSIRVSDGYVGWSPLGPGEQVYDFLPAGWSPHYSPWIFVPVSSFGGWATGGVYLDAGRARAVFHGSRVVPCHGRRRIHRQIPRVHHAQPVRLIVSSTPTHSGARHGSSVTIYRPRPPPGAPSTRPHRPPPSVGSNRPHGAHPAAPAPGWGSPSHRPEHRASPGMGAPLAPRAPEAVRRPGVYGPVPSPGPTVHRVGVGAGQASPAVAAPRPAPGVRPNRPRSGGAPLAPPAAPAPGRRR